MELMPLAEAPPHLKAGIQGPASSGVTFAAVELACGTWRHFGQTGRLIALDSTGGCRFRREHIARIAPDAEVIVAESASWLDLLRFTELVEPNDVVWIDSISHFTRDLRRAYQADVNETRERKKQAPRDLQFQDWAPIRKRWRETFVAWFHAVPAHVIVCGRIRNVYDTIEKNGREQRVKVGTEMRVEDDFGFEPYLIAELERVRNLQAADGEPPLRHRATVLVDRFDGLRGRSTLDPSFDFFRPHVSKLRPSVPDASRSRGAAPSGEAGPPTGDATSSRSASSPSERGRRTEGEAAAEGPLQHPGEATAAAEQDQPPHLWLDDFDNSQRHAIRTYADHYKLDVGEMLQSWEGEKAELLEKVGFQRGRPYDVQRGRPW